MRHRQLAAVAALALLAACNLTSPAPSVPPGATVQADGAECPPIDILASSGARVELTGVWRSKDNGVYNINQDGSCLYWMGMSQYVGEEPGNSWTNVFIGTVRSDFTIVGRWGDVPFPAVEQCQVLCDRLGRGTMTLQIEFDDSGEVERPVLRVLDMSGDVGSGSIWSYYRDFGGSVWVLEESLSAPTELLGTLGGSASEGAACVWIESNDQRYELIGSGEWAIRFAPVSVQTGDGRILARVGDPIRVVGQLSTPFASCTEQAILVEELDPTP